MLVLNNVVGNGSRSQGVFGECIIIYFISSTVSGVNELRRELLGGGSIVTVPVFMTSITWWRVHCYSACIYDINYLVEGPLLQCLYL